MGVRLEAGRIATMPVPIKDSGGVLLPTAIPSVRIVKVGHALSEDLSDDPAHEPDISSRVKHCLHAAPLAGFVGEGMAPYGVMTEAQDAALSRAVFSGLPVVNVGRGNTEGMTYIRPPFIGGSNLTATKARLLLMACLMKFGAPPPAADPTSPTPSEVQATMAHMAAYQAVFDTH
jgi:hypothetical protein